LAGEKRGNSEKILPQYHSGSLVRITFTIQITSLFLLCWLRPCDCGRPGNPPNKLYRILQRQFSRYSDGLQTGRPRNQGLNSGMGNELISFPHREDRLLGTPSFQWASGFVSTGVKRPRLKADRPLRRLRIGEKYHHCSICLQGVMFN
jgi:hypothetical protein